MKLANNCIDCTLCRNRKKVVWGDGPHPATIMLVGEAPGKMEDAKGLPFIGPSGKELWHTLWRYGIYREDVYVTNLCKCRPKDDGDPNDDEIEACAHKWLHREIELVQPKLIVPLGRLASWWLTGQKDLTMELMHGFVYPSNNPWVAPVDVLPCYHPAAGLHQPNLLAQCQWDLAHIRPAVREELSYGPRVANPYTGPLDYRVVNTAAELFEILTPDHTGVVAIDTEACEEGKPWCLTATTRPGSAAMIMADRLDLAKCLTRHILALRLIPVIHNILYDIPQLGAMGVELDIPNCLDTMTMAYHLQFIPRGLKPLSYRLAGIKMESYEDTVRPAKYGKAVEYLEMVGSMQWPDPDLEVVIGPDGTQRIKKPQNVGKKVGRALKDIAAGRCEEPWDRWRKMEGTEVVEEVCGPMPGGWLSDLKLEDAKSYACQDSDCTRRIYPRLRQMCEERGLM